MALRSQSQANTADGSNWRIWTVIDQLEAKQQQDENSDFITNKVIQVLQRWGSEWSGRSGFQSLLNKKSLLHEVEESIVALQTLHDWLEQRSNNTSPVTLVDVCCGKGITSMLTSYVFCNNTSTVSDIIMLDKQDINWNHISASNGDIHSRGEDRPFIETWQCNLHEIDSVVERLEDKQQQLALIGIHLCKQLSPACASIVNALGPEKAPFLCLAPCCLPLAARNFAKTNRQANGMPMLKKKTTIAVRTFESAEERQARKDANQKRLAAKKRTFIDQPCVLCAGIHPVQKCGLLPTDDNERRIIFERAALLRPCWKCGEVGHQKSNCPNNDVQESSKPRLTLPPAVDMNLTEAFLDESRAPFDCYCDMLSKAIERDNVKIYDSGLVNNDAHHDNDANRDNWNAQ
eukprot:CAMPEP_0201725260 /NCGR_PEP_ID=MMETSP0593-20130828/8710_1 /ASSEMBLY_ACC=CAM_ASM_000672 /TAXON_ID=267983 /ORGANISM="Skeletonema japonicum, Strain CCMP2506" /LENGTH=403 /DNA_ID=CAMNT_0048216611 /DNA_START=100 /DNA_END=1308 /DNA_ORIENTATION=-